MSHVRKGILLAGGAGTRLRARLGDLPKPMIPVAGKPLLEHQVELAHAHGFTDLIFFVHYRADLIENHFGNGGKFGVRIEDLALVTQDGHENLYRTTKELISV